MAKKSLVGSALGHSLTICRKLDVRGVSKNQQEVGPRKEKAGQRSLQKSHELGHERQRMKHISQKDELEKSRPSPLPGP